MRIAKIKCLLCSATAEAATLRVSPEKLAEQHGWYECVLKRYKGKRENRLEGFVCDECGTRLITQT